MDRLPPARFLPVLLLAGWLASCASIETRHERAVQALRVEQAVCLRQRAQDRLSETTQCRLELRETLIWGDDESALATWERCPPDLQLEPEWVEPLRDLAVNARSVTLWRAIAGALGTELSPVSDAERSVAWEAWRIALGDDVDESVRLADLARDVSPLDASIQGLRDALSMALFRAHQRRGSRDAYTLLRATRGMEWAESVRLEHRTLVELDRVDRRGSADDVRLDVDLATLDRWSAQWASRGLCQPAAAAAGRVGRAGLEDPVRLAALAREAECRYRLQDVQRAREPLRLLLEENASDGLLDALRMAARVALAHEDALWVAPLLLARLETVPCPDTPDGHSRQDWRPLIDLLLRADRNEALVERVLQTSRACNDPGLAMLAAARLRLAHAPELASQLIGPLAEDRPDDLRLWATWFDLATLTQSWDSVVSALPVLLTEQPGRAREVAALLPQPLPEPLAPVVDAWLSRLQATEPHAWIWWEHRLRLRHAVHDEVAFAALLERWLEHTESSAVGLARAARLLTQLRGDPARTQQLLLALANHPDAAHTPSPWASAGTDTAAPAARHQLLQLAMRERRATDISEAIARIGRAAVEGSAPDTSWLQDAWLHDSLQPDQRIDLLAWRARAQRASPEEIATLAREWRGTPDAGEARHLATDLLRRDPDPLAALLETGIWSTKDALIDLITTLESERELTAIERVRMLEALISVTQDSTWTGPALRWARWQAHMDSSALLAEEDTHPASPTPRTTPEPGDSAEQWLVWGLHELERLSVEDARPAPDLLFSLLASITTGHGSADWPVEKRNAFARAWTRALFGFAVDAHEQPWSAMISQDPDTVMTAVDALNALGARPLAISTLEALHAAQQPRGAHGRWFALHLQEGEAAELSTYLRLVERDGSRTSLLVEAARVAEQAGADSLAWEIWGQLERHLPRDPSFRGARLRAGLRSGNETVHALIAVVEQDLPYTLSPTDVEGMLDVLLSRGALEEAETLLRALEGSRSPSIQQLVALWLAVLHGDRVTAEDEPTGLIEALRDSPTRHRRLVAEWLVRWGHDRVLLEAIAQDPQGWWTGTGGMALAVLTERCALFDRLEGCLQRVDAMGADGPPSQALRVARAMMLSRSGRPNEALDALEGLPHRVLRIDTEVEWLRCLVHPCERPASPPSIPPRSLVSWLPPAEAAQTEVFTPTDRLAMAEYALRMDDPMLASVWARGTRNGADSMHPNLAEALSWDADRDRPRRADTPHDVPSAATLMLRTSRTSGAPDRSEARAAHTEVRAHRSLEGLTAVEAQLDRGAWGEAREGLRAFERHTSSPLLSLRLALAVGSRDRQAISAAWERWKEGVADLRALDEIAGAAWLVAFLLRHQETPLAQEVTLRACRALTWQEPLRECDAVLGQWARAAESGRTRDALFVEDEPWWAVTWPGPGRGAWLLSLGRVDLLDAQVRACAREGCLGALPPSLITWGMETLDDPSMQRYWWQLWRIDRPSLHDSPHPSPP